MNRKVEQAQGSELSGGLGVICAHECAARKHAKERIETLLDSQASDFGSITNELGPSHRISEVMSSGRSSFGQAEKKAEIP